MEHFSERGSLWWWERIRSVPEGYELSEVAVAKRAGATGAFEGNPATIKAVSLSYRRGLDQFVVTTRLVGASASEWSDPFATGEGLVRARERPAEAGLRTGRVGRVTRRLPQLAGSVNQIRGPMR